MLPILARTLSTAAREKQWDAPGHWTADHSRPPTARRHRNERRQEFRRWLRDTGIL
ncbi:hypothetical protein HKCCE3408_09610 [Rhodobacterales bacterium HKCCE3408]|nr:hypothetical protein [Rhodobacterales bacterium HKCCE3408]